MCIRDRAENLWHTRPALGAQITQHDHIPPADPSFMNGRYCFFLTIKDPGGPAETAQIKVHKALPHHRSFGGQVAPQHNQAALRLQGPLQRSDNLIIVHPGVLDLSLIHI